MNELLLRMELYLICKALVRIVDHEGSDYGFPQEVRFSEEFIKAFEEETSNERLQDHL